MPAPLHPQAKFDPIPPDLDLHDVVENNPNFSWVLRISMAQIRNLSQQEFENLVNIHVIQQGKPLVISGWEEILPKDLFSAEWLESTYDKKQENVRDITAQGDIPMTLGHYMRSMRQLTNQWNPTNFRDERRQRLYLKDIDCPPEWHESLQGIMPPNLFYMNENVTDRGVEDAGNDRDAIFRTRAQSAPAGDLMSSLPEEMRAQNLMCYVGHEGTYTAAHREMCASLGQNIMVEASGGEDGEKPGSSVWFMTETNDREVVREYFLSMLGHDIEIEKHFAQINAWKKATFPVYIVEQKPGDFILIPPLAAHQVWNRGTRTIKVAWNRTTVETLEMAMKEALPKARLVCRDEQYKNKAIVYYTLRKYAAELEAADENDDMGLLGLDLGQARSPRTQQLADDFKRLFRTFSDILTDEMFATKEKEPEFLPFDSCVTCSYCRSNIFNRFLTCKHCVRPLLNGDEDAYDVCMECYAMGRSCLCVARLQWCEQWNWNELVDNYEHWRTMIIKNDGFVDMESSPLPLEIARRQRRKKSLAQICQEGLKRRPFKDITKPPEPETAQSESEPEVDDEGRVKKKKRKRKQKKGETRRCHVCCHKDYAYKVHMCTNNCAEGYCYGVLYRAFDMTPQAVQEDENWKCPKCLGICNCGACRRSGNMNPYTPKNTSLGHDTRPIADDRSVEMLVDFRIHNLSWLKAAGEESRSNSSKRMQRLREQADVAKSQEQANQVAADEDAHAAANGHGPDLNGAMPPTNGDDADMSVDMTPANGVDEHIQEGLASAPMLPEDHPMAPPQVSLQAQEEGDKTTYPEPSMTLPQHLIGMGYYEKDDSPDKILFYPYETPTAESMVLDEPDVSEYLKKSIRAAKRKARQADDDDPDFFIGRRERKRQKEQAHEDIQLDPALFSTPTSGAPGEAEGTAEEREGEAEGEDGPSLSLRRAKPRHSYAETEADAFVDTPEDIVSYWNAGKRKEGSPTRRELEQQKGPKEPKEQKEPKETPEGTPSRRGRPPKSLFSAPEEPTQPKRRGRPPKSRLSNVVSSEDQPEDVDEEVEVPGEGHHTLDDELQIIARDLEKELAGEDGATGRRGRARRAPDYREAEISGEDEPASEPEPKKRGRPRRSAAHELNGAKQDSRKRGPGRPRRSAAREDVDSEADEPGDENEAEPEPRKRGPGQPKRDATQDVDGDFRPAPAARDESDAEPEPEPKKRGPGRPRRSEAQDLDRDFRPAPTPRTRGTRGDKRGRGRPRRSEERASVSPPPPESSMKMMSMAERMRLKGKKIKITSRKFSGVKKAKEKEASPAAAESTDVTIPENQPEPEQEPEFQELDGSSSGGESIPAGATVQLSGGRTVFKGGRTVFKMGDVLSEAGSESESEESEGSGGEIPGRVAVRGRGGFRGRARGRGRGRGRPRAWA